MVWLVCEYIYDRGDGKFDADLALCRQPSSSIS